MPRAKTMQYSEWRTDMIKIINLTILFLSILSALFLAAVWADDPCKEADEMWRKRQEFDIAYRKKRIELRKQQIEYRVKSNEYDEKLMETRERILEAPRDKREALWDEYTKTGDAWDKLWDQYKGAFDGYSKLYLERTKRDSMKNDELKLRYLCLINEPLNKKLGEVIAGMKEDTRMSPGEKTEFRSLAAARAKLIGSLKDEWERSQGEAEVTLKKIEELTQKLRKIYADDNETDGARDGEYEKLSDTYDKMDEKLDEYSDRITDLSKGLLNYLSP